MKWAVELPIPPLLLLLLSLLLSLLSLLSMSLSLMLNYHDNDEYLHTCTAITIMNFIINKQLIIIIPATVKPLETGRPWDGNCRLVKIDFWLGEIIMIARRT